MNLREAHAGDIEAIAGLHAESWRSAYRGQYRDEFLDGPVYADRLAVWRGRLIEPAPNQYTIVAEDSGAIAGFACAFGADDRRWGTLLDNIHVDAQRKRGGIGTLLIAEIALWADRAYPNVGFFLWVLEANAPARRFYERYGARNAGQERFEPPGGGTIVSLRYVWADPAALVAATGQ